MNLMTYGNMILQMIWMMGIKYGSWPSNDEIWELNHDLAMDWGKNYTMMKNYTMIKSNSTWLSNKLNMEFLWISYEFPSKHDHEKKRELHHEFDLGALVADHPDLST